MQRRKRGNSSLTIKEVAEHTGKIILDSAFNLADWIERIKQLAEPQYQISDSYFEDDSVSSFNDNYNVTENNCNRLNKTTRLILAKTWPNDIKVNIDILFKLIRIDTFRLFIEKYLWEYLDTDEDGIVSNGDIYLFITNLNIWKILYYMLKKAQSSCKAIS